MTTLPRGLYTALITPFDNDGNIDFAGLEKNIEEQISSHVAGIVLNGSTGEGTTLTHEEEKETIQYVRELIGARTTLVVGVGSPSTQSCVKKVEIAARCGADAILVLSPYSNKPSQEGLFYHFQALALASSVPLILYNHPGRCGVSIAFDTLRRLVTLPHIVGIKDCSGDLHYFMELTRLFKSDLQIFSGDDAFGYAHVALGGAGLFSVASNLVPHVMVKLISLVLERRFDEALSLHYKLLPLFNALNLETNPIPVKRGMELLGKPSGSPRLPLTPLSTHYSNILEQLLCNVHPSLKA